MGDVALSPLNSVPKPDSDERLFILDLSWPTSSSVNDGISKHFYLGEPVTLRSAVDDIADRIVRLGVIFVYCCLTLLTCCFVRVNY